MLIALKSGVPREEVEKINRRLEEMGLEITFIEGAQQSVFALLGDTTNIDLDAIEANKYSPTLVAAFRIADALGVSIEEVFQYKYRASRVSDVGGESRQNTP